MGASSTVLDVLVQSTTRSNVLAEHIDATRFPLLRGYLENLPDGLRSYPHCQMLASTAVSMQKDHADLWADPMLPPPLRAAFRQPLQVGKFAPVVLLTCQSLVVRDRLGISEQQYVDEAVKQTWIVLNGPMYRALIRVLSPHLLLLGLSNRWGAFFQGCELTSCGGTRTSHRLSLRGPPRIFTSLWLRFLRGMFEDVLRVAHAPQPRVTLTLYNDTVTYFDLKWE